MDHSVLLSLEMEVIDVELSGQEELQVATRRLLQMDCQVPIQTTFWGEIIDEI